MEAQLTGPSLRHWRIPQGNYLNVVCKYIIAYWFANTNYRFWNTFTYIAIDWYYMLLWRIPILICIRHYAITFWFVSWFACTQDIIIFYHRLTPQYIHMLSATAYFCIISARTLTFNTFQNTFLEQNYVLIIYNPTCVTHVTLMC